MPTLYVTEPGAYLEKEYQRLVVSKDDERLMRVPLLHVSDVVLVGRVGVTTPALHTLLENGVPLSLLNASGRLLGRLVPPALYNIPLRHKQYERARDPAFCLKVARAIAAAKIRNERALARRILRTRDWIPASEADRLTEALRKLPDAPDLDSLRGLEGAAARAYFSVFRLALAEGWESPRRSRRPPRDPFNALLSFGYSLLNQNVMTALEIVGLDPYDGFFHADKYGRPSLALDLVEEFRSVIVDSVVLTVINKHILAPDDFQPGEDGQGVFLTRPGLRKFLSQYSARLQTEVLHPSAGKALTYQKCFEVQARLLRKVIEGERDDYPAFLTK
jgi:CRISPR-associated protein Cas1